MVAMFLLTIGHNAKNRTCQVLLHRSGETVSRTIKCVLVAILNFDVLLLAKPIPVPEECKDHRWKYFKVNCRALKPSFIQYIHFCNVYAYLWITGMCGSIRWNAC
ncbi:hypothetical protein LINPERHAP1_LOCUS30001 [Linum perenne]